MSCMLDPRQALMILHLLGQNEDRTHKTKPKCSKVVAVSGTLVLLHLCFECAVAWNI